MLRPAGRCRYTGTVTDRDLFPHAYLGLSRVPLGTSARFLGGVGGRVLLRGRRPVLGP
jgi:hypothetical protein